MKRVALFVLFACTLLFTSCIEILENIVLKKDGTGSYALTMDMSNLLKDEFMAGMLKKSEGDDKKDFPEADTTIYGKDLPAEEKGKDADLWNRMSMRTIASEKDKKLVVSFMLDFKDPAEISFLMKNIDKLGSKAQKPGGGNSDTPPTDMLIPSNVTYTLQKNELVRKTNIILKKEETEDENASMMKMFLGDAKYTINYELPGRVKKTTIEGAKINGNAISTEMKLLDLMDNELKLDGSIRF